MTSKKVVQLRCGGAVGVLAAHRSLIEDALNLVLDGVEPGFAPLFEEVEERFFELAEKAPDNRRATLYFDAQRGFRAWRAHVPERFRGACRAPVVRSCRGGRCRVNRPVPRPVVG